MNKARREKIERRKALEAWSREVRKRDEGKCQMCGSVKFIQAHHIIPKELPDTRLDIENGLSICCGCHKYNRKRSPHKNALYFSAWLMRHKPVQYNYLIWKINEQLWNEQQAKEKQDSGKEDLRQAY